MKVLIVNNFVREGSGIDASVELEARILADRGHSVGLLRRDNADLATAGSAARAAMLAWSLYSLPVRAELGRRLEVERPDLVHLHNLVPFVTGAAYDACRRRGVPTVQHLRNYRAFCPSSYAFRAGKPCDACDGTAFAACLLHRCYRGSPLASSGLVAARWIDWAKGRRSGYDADLYIANSRHTADRHVARGLVDPATVHVLHNAAEDLSALLRAGAADAGRHGDARTARRLVYVGSLISAKGVWMLLDLATALPEFELHVVGAGPVGPALVHSARQRRLPNVVFDGLLEGAAKAAVWAGSFLTVVPSLWDEPFGLVVPESYSLGIPVLATTRGGLAETVTDGVTGVRLDESDVSDAAARVRALWDDQARYATMRTAARTDYERRFKPDVFATRLEELLRLAATHGTGREATS